MNTPTPPTPRPRGVRNNNPLNVRANPDYIWRHQTGVDPDGYLIFAEPVWGIRCAAIVIDSYRREHQIQTLQGIIYRWAPPGNNPTADYVRFVCQKTHLMAMTVIDPATDAQPILMAMTEFENGYQPYLADTYAMALKLSHIR